MMCVISLVLCAGTSFSQSSDSVVIDEAQDQERLFDRIESEPEDLQSMDEITWRLEHPYDLNTVTRQELESIPGLTPSEITALINSREAVRRFTAVDQVRAIEGIGETIHGKIAGYVTVIDGRSRNLIELRSRATRDLQPRRGDLDSTFLGSPLKTYSRLTFDAGGIQSGILFEKDGGERFSHGFVSGYVSAVDIGFVTNMLVGDFSIGAGQGLVLWRGASPGKGSEAMSVVKKSGLILQPYRSTDEFHFFRGVAASSSFDVGIAELAAAAFFSRRLLDGTRDTLGNVTSLYEEGLFRTTNELDRHKSIAERAIGTRLQLSSADGWSFGTTTYRATFDRTIVGGRTFDFGGTAMTVTGFDASATIGRISLFGEIAGSGGNEFAGIVGSILNIGKHSNVVVVYREYAPGFNNFRASGFGERSDSRNERGLYMGVDIQTSRFLRLSGYVDQFRFPWRTSSNPLPSSGQEVLVETDARLSRKVSVIVRFTHVSVSGTEPDVDPFGRDIRPLVERSQQKYRLTATCKVSSTVRVKGRLELTRVDWRLLNTREMGYLAFQDIAWTISKRFAVLCRLTFFHTDSFESRLYEYENDLKGVFANPALYGLGRRWYVLLRCSIAPALTLSAKYSETQKEGVTSLGSGQSKISGDLDNRVSLQLDVTL